MPVFLIVQLFYWLGLATWLGGVAFLSLAIPVIIRTVRDADPTLPMVLSVNLERAHSSLLVTSIFINLATMLVRVELACAGVLLLAIGAQWVEFRANSLTFSIIRTVLYTAALVMVLYDWRAIAPRVARYHKEYIDKADDPEAAAAAREQFEKHYRESVTVLGIQVLLLTGLVLFSANVSNAIALSMR